MQKESRRRNQTNTSLIDLSRQQIDSETCPQALLLPLYSYLFSVLGSFFFGGNWLGTIIVWEELFTCRAEASLWILTAIFTTAFRRTLPKMNFWIDKHFANTRIRTRLTSIGDQSKVIYPASGVWRHKCSWRCENSGLNWNQFRVRADEKFHFSSGEILIKEVFLIFSF